MIRASTAGARDLNSDRRERPAFAGTAGAAAVVDSGGGGPAAMGGAPPSAVAVAAGASSDAAGAVAIAPDLPRSPPISPRVQPTLRGRTGCCSCCCCCCCCCCCVSGAAGRRGSTLGGRNMKRHAACQSSPQPSIRSSGDSCGASLRGCCAALAPNHLAGLCALDSGSANRAAEGGSKAAVGGVSRSRHH